MIMVGGVLFNFILALFIYSMVLFAWGDTYLPLKNVKQGMDFSETFINVGFRDGDILLRADDEELERYNEDCLRKVVEAHNVTVLRDGVETVIPIPDDMMQRVLRDKQGFAAYRFPMVVKSLSADDMPAAQAGMQPGDSIVSINDVPVVTYYEAAAMLADNKSKEITLGYYRDGELRSASLVPDSLGRIGVGACLPTDLYQTETRTYGFLASFPAGVKLGINTLKGYVSDMQYVFTKEGASSLGGFATIGSIFPDTWNWRAFWMQSSRRA